MNVPQRMKLRSEWEKNGKTDFNHHLTLSLKLLALKNLYKKYTISGGQSLNINNSTKCNPIADYTMVTIEILISHAVGVHYVCSKLVSPEKLIS